MNLRRSVNRLAWKAPSWLIVLAVVALWVFAIAANVWWVSHTWNR
jgi:uncharacterized protein YggT (Ycf19 family)